MYDGDSYIRLTAPGVVYRGACDLTDVIGHNDGTADDVSIYDGLDDQSGVLFGKLEVNLYTNNCAGPRHPVHFQRGIYVVLGSHVTEVTICYRPMRDDPPVVMEQEVNVVIPKS